MVQVDPVDESQGGVLEEAADLVFVGPLIGSNR